ncbi:MAG: HEAT repeat domain-containing protein [Lentisphaeria bacterium]
MVGPALISGFKTALAVFPLFIPVWQERPLQSDDLALGPRPVKMADNIVEWQARQGLKWADEPALRCRLVRELGKTQNAYAAKLLIDHLPNDTPAVQATIMRQLINLPLDRLSTAEQKKIESRILDSHTAVRQAAITLYPYLPEADSPPLLQVLQLSEDTKTVRATLRSLSALKTETQFEALARWRQHPDPTVAEYAWKLSCRAPDTKQYLQELKEATKHPEPHVRFVIAEALSHLPEKADREIAELLAVDPSEACRARTAASLAAVRKEFCLPLLVQLSNDKDYSVRLEALKGLQYFPLPKSATAVVDAFQDPSRLVSKQAELSTIALYNKFPDIARRIIPYFGAKRDRTRFHVFNAIGEMKAIEHRDALVAALEKEKKPKHLVAGLRAVYNLQAVDADSLIRRHSRHSKAIVRAAAARAAGILTADYAHEFLMPRLKDQNSDVRYQAIIASGRVRDAGATSAFLNILRDSDPQLGSNARLRAAACWAAAQLPEVPENLLKRMKKQATEKVIKTPDGPIYDSSTVLVSCAFALGDITRHQANAEPYAKAVFRHLRAKQDEEALFDSDFKPSPVVKECVRQAEAFSEGRRQVQPARRPSRTVRLSYKKAQ